MDDARDRGTPDGDAQGGARTVLVVAAPSDFATRTLTALLDAGFAVSVAHDAAAARGRVRRTPPPAAAFLNLLLPGGDALGLLADLQAAAPRMPVIAVAAPGALTRAAMAVDAGAFDHLVTPQSAAVTLDILRNALQVAADPPPPLGLRSAAPAMQAALARLHRLAPARGPVLLLGERGAGRRAAAMALHAASAWADGPFVRVDCAAHDDPGLLAALFGEGGADGGGALAQAAGGTLMIDGVSTVGPAMQARLLRLLQTPMPEDAPPRLVFASAADLRALSREGLFREELHYRLAVATVTLPPLRDRPEDVAPLALAALRADSDRAGRPCGGFHPAVLRAFAAHAWPGNLHQLHAVVRAAAAVAEGRRITLEMLPPDFLLGGHSAPPRRPIRRPSPFAASDADAAAFGADAGPDAAGDPDPPLHLRVVPLVGARLADVEAALIEATLARCGGSTVRAAQILGVAPSTLYRRRDRAEGAGPADA